MTLGDKFIYREEDAKGSMGPGKKPKVFVVVEAFASGGEGYGFAHGVRWTREDALSLYEEVLNKRKPEGSPECLNIEEHEVE